MSPRVPKAYLEARRAEILEAAAKCFMEKGFHNTTMQDIYKTTKLSPGAVYNYFRNKEEIVSAAVEMSQQRNSAIITAAASGNPDQALKQVSQSFIDLAKQIDMVKAAAVDLALYSEAIRNQRVREILRAGHDAIITKLVELVKHYQRLGMFNKLLDPMAISQAFISLSVGIEIHKALNPDFNLDSYAAVIEAIIEGNFSQPGKKNRRISKPGSAPRSVSQEASR